MSNFVRLAKCAKIWNCGLFYTMNRDKEFLKNMVNSLQGNNYIQLKFYGMNAHYKEMVIMCKMFNSNGRLLYYRNARVLLSRSKVKELQNILDNYRDYLSDDYFFNLLHNSVVYSLFHENKFKNIERKNGTKLYNVKVVDKEWVSKIEKEILAYIKTEEN